MRDERPFFSIVIPTFNRENELRTSIASVLNQNFKNWELLIIDDGSTDETEDLIDAYKVQNSRIYYFKRPDSRQKGPGACRNIGIEQATGEYVAFLDSDDEWSENKLESDYAVIQAGIEVRAIYSDCFINDGNKQYRAPSRHIMKGESYEDLIFSGENFSATSSYVIKLEVLSLLKFDENLRRHEDIDLFIRIGNLYGWTHNDMSNTVMNWNNVSDRFSAFESIVVFYQRYKGKSYNANNLARYLRWAWVCAARFEPSYKNLIHEELKKIYKGVDLKYQIFILFPEFLFLGWKFLRKIKSWVNGVTTSQKNYSIRT